MTEWQSIETAPLSDVYSDDPMTNVLLWNAEFGAQVGYVFLRKNGDVKALSAGFVIADDMLGRPVSVEYLTTPATGGLAYIKAARAAIEAMRTPTEAMLEAGLDRLEYVTSMAEEKYNRRVTENVFGAMVDAALSPSPR